MSTKVSDYDNRFALRWIDLAQARLGGEVLYATDDFFAEKENGAFFNNQRIRVSKKNNLDECLFSTNLESLKNIDLNLRISGSAALDLAYVASGRLDGYFQKKLNIWDIAAGIVIVEEAGGKIDPININELNNHTIIASSEAINADFKKLMINF